MKPKNIKEKDESDRVIGDSSDEKKKIEQNYGKFTTNLTRESIFEFMEFD